MKKNFLLGYFLLSLLIITLSFRFSPNLYSYFSLLILIPVLLIISFLNFKNKLFKKKVLIYEMLLIFLVSIIGFIFSYKDFGLIKNYAYMFCVFYIYISILVQNNLSIINFIEQANKYLINLMAILMIIWIIYYYSITCAQHDHCPTMYVARQFHYHVIFHSNLLNIFILFNLLHLFCNSKKLDKVNFFSNTILSLTSASMIINVIWVILVIDYFILKNLFKDKKNSVYFFFFVMTLIIIFKFNEELIQNLKQNSELFQIQNFINLGEINSVLWRLEKISDFKEYLNLSFTIHPQKIFFGNQFIQNENFYHNSFFSIIHFHGLIIFSFIVYNIFKVNNLFFITLIIGYFLTTDNLLLHNFSITLTTWILMSSLTYKNELKQTKSND